jgi:hypothetical protein
MLPFFPLGYRPLHKLKQVLLFIPNNPVCLELPYETQEVWLFMVE